MLMYAYNIITYSFVWA